MTRQELDVCTQADIDHCCPAELVDLQTVTIDRTLPVVHRVSQFLEQIRNPYLFKVDDMVVKVNYSGEKPFQTMLTELLTAQGSPVLVGSDS